MDKLKNFTSKFMSKDVNQYMVYIISFAILFLLTLYFFSFRIGHDTGFHVMRFEALMDAIRNNHFPLYIDYLAADQYGYATKWFYSDFMLIPFAYLGNITSVGFGYKAMIIVYTLLCGFITYLSTYKVFKNNYVAYICTILYTFSYYRLYDTYSRGALGEVICLTFIPMVMWGLYEIIKGDYKKWYVITIAFSCMIFAHINTPAIVMIPLIIFLLINYKRLKKEPIRLCYLIVAGIVTILLTAYYLFPLLEQMLSNKFYFAETAIHKYSFNVHKGEDFKYIVRGLFSGITYSIPEIAGIGITISFAVMLRIFLSRDKEITIADMYLFVGLICLIIVSPLYPWNIFPFNVIGFIQFSWRFYTVITFILCVAGAVYYYKAFSSNTRRYIVGIPFMTIFIALLITNYGQFHSNNYLDNNNGEVGSMRTNAKIAYRLMGCEYLPERVPYINEFIPSRGNDSIGIKESTSKITAFKREERNLYFTANIEKVDYVELPLIYYKGYKARLDDSEIEIRQSDNGLIELPIEKSGNVKVYFGGTYIQKASPYITLIMTILLIGYIVWYKRKEKADAEQTK